MFGVCMVEAVSSESRFVSTDGLQSREYSASLHPQMKMLEEGGIDRETSLSFFVIEN